MYKSENNSVGFGITIPNLKPDKPEPEQPEPDKPDPCAPLIYRELKVYGVLWLSNSTGATLMMEWSEISYNICLLKWASAIIGLNW